MEAYGYIYLTTNLINGRRYVGQHSKPKFDKDYLGGGTKLRGSLKKYGRQNFKVQLIQYIYTQKGITAAHPKITKTQSFLSWWEQYWIKKLHTHVSEDGYNLQTGGGQFGRHSKEMKKANSERQLNWSPEKKAAKTKKELQTKENKSPEEKAIERKKRSVARKKRITKQSTIDKTKQNWKDKSKEEVSKIRDKQKKTISNWSEERKQKYHQDLSIGVLKANEEKAICKYCGKEVSKVIINRDHNEKCRKNPNRIWLQCPKCEKKFTQEHYLLTHINRYHYELVEQGLFPHKDIQSKQELKDIAQRRGNTISEKSQEEKDLTSKKRKTTNANKSQEEKDLRNERFNNTFKNKPQEEKDKSRVKKSSSITKSWDNYTDQERKERSNKTSITKKNQPRNYICQYCGGAYKSKKWLDKHLILNQKLEDV